MRYIAHFLFLVWAVPLGAASLSDEQLEILRNADVILLGETHDNPHHHDVQAELTELLGPSAIVWEMLDEVQAARVLPELVTRPEELADVLNWAESGWPDFAMYAPIFAAAPSARSYGALVSRDSARAAMEIGVVEAFGAGADQIGLTIALDEDEQQAREAMQLAAHCDAMPAEMLPLMVDIQRLRDARLAQQSDRALRETDGPVVVITGNGHVREDWGAPVYLERLNPQARVVTVGQGEDGRKPEGQFDLILDAPGVDRPDPCDAFRQDG